MNFKPSGCLLALVLAACAGTPISELPELPEEATGVSANAGWVHQGFAVAAANPLAVRAGHQILQAGGNAVDAAVAVQLVLALVEPQSSGIGGGAFLMVFNGRETLAFDGRETAPQGVSETLFLDAKGLALPLEQALVGGRAVGVPGTLRMLALAHRQHGQLPWASLFKPAIELSEQGFRISPRLGTLLSQDKFLRLDPVAAAYFYDEAGRPWPAGHVLKNPEFGAVLRRVASSGADAFYDGEVAQAIVDKVRQHPTNPGVMSLQDLHDYRAIQRTPLCFDHAARTAPSQTPQPAYRLCGMPPPSSGTLAIGQILGLLQHLPALPNPTLNAGPTSVPSADWLHRYTEAARLSFADRAMYVGDPDFVAPPAGRWGSLLDPAYLARRAALIDTSPQAHRQSEVQAGHPNNVHSRFAPMPEQPEHGTSHISIVDAQGRAVAMTTTIESGFGARIMVNRQVGLRGGFLLNNELTDFSFVPRDAQGHPVANRVEPGKRPRSSMSPTLVFEQATDQLRLVAGSPGGAYIIHFTAKTLMGVLDWGLSPQAAIDLPNFAAFEGPIVLEAARFPQATLDALKGRGHAVIERALPSGIQAIQIGPQALLGGADPRREGLVMGGN